ncbi:MAG: helix-turn-helix domain-containing protein, partial [Coriobacteriia bacterium]|nr:helix-turn-helix domain-containing protein [Coriobacteriia bacterium]
PHEEHERDCCCMAEVLKVDDVSKELQVSVRRARELIGSGKIRMIQGLNPGTIRVSREDLDEFIKDSSGK